MTTPLQAPDQAPPQPWTPSLDSFGARLALVRQRMGWNVKEAAVACGLPPESWRRWERDGLEPRRMVTIALTIATRTGVDIDWLVYGPSKPGVQPIARYLTIETLANPEPHRALEPRLLVRHGDGRRKPNGPVGNRKIGPVTRAVSLPASA